MAQDRTRRGKPETRTPFERARENFEAAKGTIRETRKTVLCPAVIAEPGGKSWHVCDAPMTCVSQYRGKDGYRFTGVCSADASHNLERFGYYSTEVEG